MPRPGTPETDTVVGHRSRAPKGCCGRRDQETMREQRASTSTEALQVSEFWRRILHTADCTVAVGGDGLVGFEPVLHELYSKSKTPSYSERDKCIVLSDVAV